MTGKTVRARWLRSTITRTRAGAAKHPLTLRAVLGSVVVIAAEVTLDPGQVSLGAPTLALAAVAVAVAAMFDGYTRAVAALDESAGQLDATARLPHTTPDGHPVTYILAAIRPVFPDFETAVQYLESHPEFPRPDDTANSPTGCRIIEAIEAMNECMDTLLGESGTTAATLTQLPDGREAWLVAEGSDAWAGRLLGLHSELPGLCDALAVEILQPAAAVLR